MSWAIFMDESGQDRREAPYEVLAGIAVADRKLWQLIRDLSDAQERLFGMRLFEAYGKEAKAQKLLKRKVFRHAAQAAPIEPELRTQLAHELLMNGANPTRAGLSALAQAKLAYVADALDLTHRAGAVAFASIVPRNAQRPQFDGLRKDYAFLFERVFYFLNSRSGDPMGYLVFDELDKSASHVLLGQITQYFSRTSKGRTRSRLIIPEPFFVHSDLTTLVQIADLTAYTLSWGVRLKGMIEARRDELEPFAAQVMRLRFTQATPGGHTHYGFKVIGDLRAAGAQ